MRKILFLLALSCHPLQAKTQPWVIENQNSLTWKAIEDDMGGIYLVWTHQESAMTRLMGQHITAEGIALWPAPGQTLLPVVSDSSSWTAFADSQKGLILAWVQEGKIDVQRWTPDGQPLWKTPMQVSDGRYLSLTPVGIADGGGGAYLVWAEKRYANRAVLLSQHLNAQSAPLWPVTVRVSLRPSDQRLPNVAFDGAAGMILSWADYRDTASDWRVQRINFQGFRLWGLEGIEMAAPAGSGSSALRIAPWGQGSLTVAWIESQNGHSRIQDRQINPRGIPLSENKIPPYSTGDQWNPVLTGDGEGHYWVGWEDNRNERTWQVYVRSGANDIPLAVSDGDQGRLALAEDGVHGVYAVWLENRKGSASLYMQHLNSTGQPLWEALGREVAPELKHPDTPALVVLGSGRTALAWADQPNKGQYALYWQLFP